MADQPPPARPPGPLHLGVDVGGTKTLAVLVAGSPGTAVELDRAVGPSGAGDPEVVDGMEAAVAELLGRADGEVVGIGLGLAGFVDRRGIVRQAPNAPGLEDVDLVGRFADRFGLPVVAENDANCVAVAAHVLQAPEVRHLVAVTLGTGIGGGLVVDGRLVRGAHGFAGEPGHMVVDPSGPPCPCGQRGCWERFASGKALGELARAAAAAGEAPGLVARAGSVEGVRGEDVAALVAAGDPGAGLVLDRFAGHVALGVANLVVLLDPGVVVIGGGVSALGDHLVGRVRRELADRYAATVTGRDVRVVAAAAGPAAGALGAALVAAGADRPPTRP